MFIIDSNHRLIAAEAEDLTRWGVQDIYEAAQAFSRGTLRLDSERNLFILGTGESVTCHIESMESLMGSWILCRFPKPESSVESVSTTESLQESPAQAEEEELLAILPLEEEPQAKTEETSAAPESATAEEEEFHLLPLEEPSEESSVSQEKVESEESTPEELLSLAPLEEESEEVSLSSEEETRDTAETTSVKEGTDLQELLPLEEPESEEESLSLMETVSEKPAVEAWEKIASEFHPDLQANARKIALDYDEYAELLREFISDSRGMQERLLSSDAQERKDAASILEDAVALLYLQPLDKLLTMLDQAPAEKRGEIVETYTHLLEQLQATLVSKEAHPAKEESELHPSQVPGIVSEATPETTETTSEITGTVSEVEATEAQTPPTKTEASKAATQVDIEDFLKGVKPVAIEFSLQLAANELSLPEDLVLEFIEDFDKQGHEYLPVLIEAYQTKDLKRLQETAHMLKGAASNLRIEAMVDNLYALQFDNEIERAPERIRLFAGQLMSLDKYLEQMNRK